MSGTQVLQTLGHHVHPVFVYWICLLRVAVLHGVCSSSKLGDRSFVCNSMLDKVERTRLSKPTYTVMQLTKTLGVNRWRCCTLMLQVAGIKPQFQCLLSLRDLPHQGSHQRSLPLCRAGLGISVFSSEPALQSALD